MARNLNNRGVTLLELVVAIGIFALLSLGVAWILIMSVRSNAIIWDHLEAQRDGRRAVQQVVNDVRRAEASSVGGYMIASAGDNELIIYSNVDRAGYRERVRYFLDGTTVKKGIIVPSGNPLVYDVSAETVVDIAAHVTNASAGIPVFTYYDTAYTGTETAIAQPVAAGDVRVIRMKLVIDKDPAKTPSAIEVESVAQLRNLKLNDL